MTAEHALAFGLGVVLAALTFFIGHRFGVLQCREALREKRADLTAACIILRRAAVNDKEAPAMAWNFLVDRGEHRAVRQ